MWRQIGCDTSDAGCLLDYAALVKVFVPPDGSYALKVPVKISSTTRITTGKFLAPTRCLAMAIALLVRRICDDPAT
jgi:hypothetical protein